ncbi:hypothetical protein ABU614_10190 [Lysobacter firmicutimachus]|uniref:Uncharacterized protein n=1 Tax=Lysobacter firmicutimachus TaxID=1792846 RepID=A0AAU8MX06_9GAMM
MSRYVLIRGWIECTFDQVAEIRSVVNAVAEHAKLEGVASELVDSCMKGWSYPEAPINWISLVLFGAQVNRVAVPLVRRMMEAVSKIGCEVEGLFYVDDDEGDESLRWDVNEGRIDVVSRV